MEKHTLAPLFLQLFTPRELICQQENLNSKPSTCLLLNVFFCLAFPLFLHLVDSLLMENGVLWRVRFLSATVQVQKLLCIRTFPWCYFYACVRNHTCVRGFLNGMIYSELSHFTLFLGNTSYVPVSCSLCFVKLDWKYLRWELHVLCF